MPGPSLAFIPESVNVKSTLSKLGDAANRDRRVHLFIVNMIEVITQGFSIPPGFQFHERRVRQTLKLINPSCAGYLTATDQIARFNLFDR